MLQKTYIYLFGGHLVINYLYNTVRRKVTLLSHSHNCSYLKNNSQACIFNTLKGIQNITCSPAYFQKKKKLFTLEFVFFDTTLQCTEGNLRWGESRLNEN